MNAIFGDKSAETRQFFVTCANIAKRREIDGREHWTRQEWEAFVKRGRAAFGASPKALFGQLALIETLLEEGLDGKQIDAELRRMRLNRAAEERRSDERAAETRRRSERASQEAEIEEATRKELIRIEARNRAQDRAEQKGIAQPRATRRVLRTMGDDR